MSLHSDGRLMALALALGARGLGQVWPNPAVGCVVVKAGRIVGRGQTAPGGRPHAETLALEQAGAAAEGADVFVSLEPCAHHGQTPPCAAALVAAKVARVVVPIEDPDPRVAGAGIAHLRAAGIAVDVGCLAEEARCANRGFLSRVTAGRPMVTLKLATSFDGRIATASGESRWITAPEARRRVHALRARHDAVLVGGGTARVDNPHLAVRDMGVVRQPVRVVASRSLALPEGSILERTAREIPLWLLHGAGDVAPAVADRWRRAGAELLPVAVGEGRQLDPAAMLRALEAKGITRVLCEGGGALAASLLSANLVDEVVGFSAGVMLGAEGRPALGALGLERLAEAPRFRLIGAAPVGPDLMHHWERI